MGDLINQISWRFMANNMLNHQDIVKMIWDFPERLRRIVVNADKYAAANAPEEISL
jgi:hypothetical protein